MAKSITKYSILVTKAEDIIPELEKACMIAKSDRPGPVLVDIPDDSVKMISKTILNLFIQCQLNQLEKPFKQDLDKTLEMINKSKRPVIVLGAGVRLANVTSEALQLINKLQIPVCTSWAAANIPADSKLMGGTFGTHGTRAGNVIQNSDLVLAIGARLSTHETGSPMNSWVREAKTIIVTLIQEPKKFPTFWKTLDMSIECDVGVFINMLLEETKNIEISNFKPWINQVSEWHQKYPVCTPDYYKEKPINPYVFIDRLSDHLDENDVIVVDTGCAIAWTLQGFRFKGQHMRLTIFQWGTPTCSSWCFYALEKKGQKSVLQRWAS